MACVGAGAATALALAFGTDDVPLTVVWKGTVTPPNPDVDERVRGILGARGGRGRQPRLRRHPLPVRQRRESARVPEGLSLRLRQLHAAERQRPVGHPSPDRHSGARTAPESSFPANPTDRGTILNPFGCQTVLFFELFEGVDEENRAPCPVCPVHCSYGHDGHDAVAVQPVCPRSEAAGRRGLHEEDQGIHDRAVLHLAARRLPAGLEDRADAAGSPRRHRRRARQAAVLARGLPVHADGREGQPAGEGLLDRQDRRRPRDDRGRGVVGGEHREARREPRAAGQARRSAHDRHERRRGRQARRSVRAGLLHHRRDPLAGNRLANCADGAGLSTGRRREPVHPEDPQPDCHARDADRRSRRPRSAGRRLSLAPRESRQELAVDSSTGASTSHTTTIATPWR